VHQQDDPHPEIRRDHEPPEIDHVVDIRRRNDARHERQHAVRREPDHEPHQTHDQVLQRVEAGHDALADFWLLAAQRQDGESQERREDHDADDRRRSRSRQVGEDIGRDERLEQRRNCEVGRLAEPRFERGAALELACALHDAVRTQPEDHRYGDADER
jgi:hypothetical protein